MITEKAYAKINLALDVVRKRIDGYHDLKMIMVPLELHDVLTFENSLEMLLISNVDIENNAIIKTVQLVKDTFNIQKNVKIVLDKQIPIGAGLAGGSADIAATLRGLNRLWELELSMKQLEELALQLGSDTVFCLHNKPAYVYSRGESMLYIATPQINHLYIVYPDVQVSTKRVYENHEIHYRPKRFNRLFTFYVNDQMNEFFKNAYNVLTETTMKLYPELQKFKNDIRKLSHLGRMSGSGSTFYIPVFKENDLKLVKKIQKLGYKVFKTTIKQ